MKKKTSFREINDYFTTEENWVIVQLFQDANLPWSPSLGDANEAINFAQRHGLGQLLFAHPASKSLPTKEQQILKNSYLSNLARNSMFQNILDEITTNLNQKGIQSIPLKGIFLSRTIFSDIALRPMSDIDLLLPEKHIKEVFKMFDNKLSSLHKLDPFGHHLPPITYRGAMIELHNALVDLNLKYQIPMNIVWEKAVPSPDGSHLILEPLHLITHLILHTYYSIKNGGVRLGWFYDLKVVIEFYKEEISEKELNNFLYKHKLIKPSEIILSFYQFLNPNTPYPIKPKRSITKQLKKIDHYIQNSSKQENIKYGYTIAWERVLYSKNWKDRLLFIKYLLFTEKDRNQTSIPQRLIYLTKNLLQLLKKRINS